MRGLGFKMAGAVGLAGLVMAISAGAASASTNTVTVGPGTVTGRILITVPVTVVCDPLPGKYVDAGISVTVQQANGKQVSTASGGISDSLPTPSALTCDGVTQNTLEIQATPTPGSGPFHGGTAIVTANFNYDTGISYPGGYFQITNSESGTSGITVVSLHG
jgi:hypothetical protein